ncbi:MAG: bifunctional DNA-formamidopyrimidine glycosylase/DNA-(apurinic or apyrimidinic site) lyase [bacterium]|nr:bifunctional DNA-formamidopyrimidine glycosylase/DNA-(apurinic or apyrimidinic site) lyase [bacterium]
MPELPEVETIRKGLEKYLLKHKMIGVEVKLQKIITGDTKKIIGAKIKKVRRFGKALVIDLDNGYSLAIHVKLTGQLIYQHGKLGKDTAWAKLGGRLPSKWTHVIFHLDRGANLYYNDIRRFGWIRIVSTSDVEQLPFIHELGPEPFVGIASSGRAPLTLEKFREILKNRSTKIKPLLMDQKKIGGVGNIYANDALLLARIDPRRAAKSLSSREQPKLYDAILEVLKRGLKYGGATEMNFVNALGQEGGYQKYFLAYGQDGKPCPNKCGGTIKKIRIGGRGTYFCPACQK